MTDTDTNELIAQLDIEYQAAVERNDAEAMGRILADDFVLITGVGRVRTRDDLLKEARDRVAVYEYQEAEERTVRVWGDTAVVTARLRAKGEQGGEPFEVRLWYSDTYAMIDGEWRYVLGQASTRLPDAGVSQDPLAPTSTVLDIRIYRVKPGKGAEFDRLVRNETVPLARRFGHLVVDFGPSAENSDVYYLVRSFPTREERTVDLERLYGSAEWLDGYDARVSQLLVSYETVVVATSEGVVAAWTGSIES